MEIRFDAGKKLKKRNCTADQRTGRTHILSFWQRAGLEILVLQCLCARYSLFRVIVQHELEKLVGSVWSGARYASEFRGPFATLEYFDGWRLVPHHWAAHTLWALIRQHLGTSS